MAKIEAPALKDFFASPNGVCVYVEVRSISIRVEFSAPDAVGTVKLGDSEDCREARRVATTALQSYQAQLAHLFAKVESERKPDHA